MTCKFLLILVAFFSLGIGYAQVNIEDLKRNKENQWINKKGKKPYSGEFVEYFKNGNIKGKGTLVDGIVEGFRVVFHENKDTAFWRYYKNGLANGPSKEYFPGGKLQQEGNYIQGNENGPWMYYYPSGKKSAIIHYKNGIREGSFFEYDKEGVLKTAYWFKNGEVNVFQGAIPLYDQAILENPSNPQFYFYRGLCYANWFKSTEALNNYTKAIELNQNYMEAYANRATEKINLLTKEQKFTPTIEVTKSICEDLTKATELGGNKKGELNDMIFIYCEEPKRKNK